MTGGFQQSVYLTDLCTQQRRRFGIIEVFFPDETNKVDTWKKFNKVSEVYNELFISIADIPVTKFGFSSGGENTGFKRIRKLHISSHLTIKVQKRKWRIRLCKSRIWGAIMLLEPNKRCILEFNGTSTRFY